MRAFTVSTQMQLRRPYQWNTRKRVDSCADLRWTKLPWSSRSPRASLRADPDGDCPVRTRRPLSVEPGPLSMRPLLTFWSASATSGTKLITWHRNRENISYEYYLEMEGVKFGAKFPLFLVFGRRKQILGGNSVESQTSLATLQPNENIRRNIL